MESGLDGRNNPAGCAPLEAVVQGVSMESGLDGRNNYCRDGSNHRLVQSVSMESGLDGRNNGGRSTPGFRGDNGLNGVRPRWPEQFLLNGDTGHMQPNRSQWSPA